MIYLIVPIMIMLAIDGLIILGLVVILRKMGISSKKVILTSFLVFGLLIGCFSFWWGKTDFVACINIPGSASSEMVYNKYLLPYWKQTLEPIGYREIPIIELPPATPPEPPPGPGKQVGVEIVPVYDFPLKRVSDLYIPASALSWGLLGLLVQLAYSCYKRMKR